jgi:hypothetical protein
MGKVKNVYKILVEKFVGKRDHLGDMNVDSSNIKVGLTEIGCECVDWIHLAQDNVY